jgi:hypothetical protein
MHLVPSTHRSSLRSVHRAGIKPFLISNMLLLFLQATNAAPADDEPWTDDEDLPPNLQAPSPRTSRRASQVCLLTRPDSELKSATGVKMSTFFTCLASTAAAVGSIG